MLETVNLQEVKDKLYEKMKVCGWGQYLRTFMTSSDMEIILERLYLTQEIIKDLLLQ